MFRTTILVKILLALVCFSQVSFATPPGDNDYYILKYPTYRLIFDKQYLPYIEDLNERIEYYIEKFQKIHIQPINRNFTIILSSPQEQVSNALATVFPFIQLQIFPSGVENLNPLASHLWFDFTFIHELNHLFQLNYTLFPKSLKIKQSIFEFLFPYPNFLLPTLFTEGDAVFKESLWGIGGRLYSGEARALVYSQIKHYKNKPRKLAKKLINNQVYPNTRQIKYFHGGYLFTALSQNFSHKKINEFFKRSGESFFSLSTFNHSLQKTFQMNVMDLIKFYIRTFATKAVQQQSDSTAPLFKSAICPEINRFENKILLLTTNLKSTPKLRIYNVRLKEWNTKTIDIPLGKVFYLEDRYYARSTQAVEPHRMAYSVFSNGLKPHPQIQSQFVQDIFKENILSIDTTNNIIDYKLLLNNKFYDNTHSNALFDSQKNIYYFKQNKNKRILYKNKKPVFAYFGHYGKLVDIRQDGSIYFIAPTTYGSSVYKYSNGQVTRSLSSDTVIQAKTINDQEIVICEVIHNGYVYKKTTIEEIKGQPAVYRYPFETIPYFQKSKTPLQPRRSPAPQKTYIPPKKSQISALVKDEYNELTPSDLDEILKDLSDSSHYRSLDSTEEETDFLLTAQTLKAKKYSALGNTRLSQWIPLIFNISSLWTQKGLYWYSQLIFKDDLSQNNLNLSVSSHSWINYQVSAEYFNRVYPLQWSLGYHFGFLNTNHPNSEDFLRRYPLIQHRVSWTGIYTLFQKGRWRSSISSEKSFKFNRMHTTHHLIVDLLSKNKTQSLALAIPIDGTLDHFSFGWKPTWHLTYNQVYSLNTFANKRLILHLSPHYMNYFSSEKGLIHVFNTEIHLDSILHLGYEFYINPSVKYLAAWIHDTILFNENLFPIWKDFKDTGLMIQIPHIGTKSNIQYPLEISGKRLLSLGMNFLKSIHTPIYSTTMPLSLRRVIPSINFEYWIIDRPKARQKNLVAQLSQVDFLQILEFQMGLDFELLLYFQTPIRLKLLIGGSYPISTHFSPQPYAQINLQSKF